MKTLEEHGIYVPPGASGEVNILCPECSHTRKKKHDKCLSVNVDKGVWYCQHPHCDFTGFIPSNNSNARLSQRLSAEQVVRKKFYAEPREKKVEDILRQSGIEFLATRNISMKAADIAKVWSDDTWLYLPYYVDGKIVNIKRRGIKKKDFRMETGAQRTLFGIDVAKESERDTLIITEGELDVLALYTSGINNCVSVPDGAPAVGTKNYSSKFDFLDSCSDFIGGFERYIYAGDADGPGDKLADELIKRLGEGKCSRVHWPEGCKDANDVLLIHGEDTLLECIDNAVKIPVDGFVSVNDVMEDIMALHRKGDPPGMSTGFFTLDPLYTVKPGEVTVVHGIPNHGKTTFINALMKNLSTKYKWHFAVASFETPYEIHFSELSSQFMNKPFREFTPPEMTAALSWAENHFTFLDVGDKVTVDHVLSLCSILADRREVNAVVVDPYNELSQPDNMTETKYVAEMMGKLRRFGRKIKAHMFLVAHPKQLQRLPDGTFPIPQPYDISGSANFRNRADNIFCVWKDDVLEYEISKDVTTSKRYISEIHVQKIKFKSTGKCGMVRLLHDRKTGNYEDIIDDKKT